MRSFIAWVSLAATLTLASCHKKPTPPPKPPPLKVAVISGGSQQQYWKSVEAGATKAAKEAGVDVVWKAPEKEGDAGQQAALVEQALGDAKAIALAPVDDEALVEPVKHAAEKCVPVVIFDSGLRGEAGADFASYVGSDNKRIGTLAGDQLAKLLDGKGKVVMLRYAKRSASTAEREAAFLEVMKAHAPGIRVVSENRYAGATSAAAQQAAIEMRETLDEADGVFCPNESTTVGMVLTLRQIGRNGKVKFVGVDASPALVDYLKKGDVDALVAQDPVRIGYEAVKAAAALAKGEAKPPPRVETRVRVITKEDLDDPAVRTLLGPN